VPKGRPSSATDGVEVDRLRDQGAVHVEDDTADAGRSAVTVCIFPIFRLCRKTGRASPKFQARVGDVIRGGSPLAA